MSTVKRVTEEVARGLREVHPRLGKTVREKLALAVGAMLEGQAPNTVELANRLPLETERQDRREQYPLLGGEEVLEPFFST